MHKLLIAAAAVSFASGCTLLGPTGLLFTSVTVPQSWRSPTAADIGSATVLGDVDGEACASNILGLVATGEGGYDAAVKAALKQKAGATSIYDVRVDQRVFSILAIYGQYCTVVHGTAIAVNGGAPQVAPPVTP